MTDNTNNVIHLDKTSTRRWHVEISYRSGWGPTDAFDIEEITNLDMIRELDRIVEGGAEGTGGAQLWCHRW